MFYIVPFYQFKITRTIHGILYLKTQRPRVHHENILHFRSTLSIYSEKRVRRHHLLEFKFRRNTNQKLKSPRGKGSPSVLQAQKDRIIHQAAQHVPL